MKRYRTERFAHVVLPWREEVKVSFGRCGKAKNHCDRDIEAIREGEFYGAVRNFRRALEQLPKSGAKNRRLAEVYSNLGLAHEHSADFEIAS